MSRILPPKEDEGPLQTTSMRMPGKLLEKLDKVAKETGYSRNEVLLHFIQWAMTEYEAEKKGKK